MKQRCITVKEFLRGKENFIVSFSFFFSFHFVQVTFSFSLRMYTCARTYKYSKSLVYLSVSAYLKELFSRWMVKFYGRGFCFVFLLFALFSGGLKVKYLDVFTLCIVMVFWVIFYYTVMETHGLT